MAENKLLYLLKQFFITLLVVGFNEVCKLMASVNYLLLVWHLSLLSRYGWVFGGCNPPVPGLCWTIIAWPNAASSFKASGP